MIYLQEQLLIGRGSERECYRHPEDPALCIKITYNDTIISGKQQNLRDYQYFKKLKKRQIDWSHLPRCFGWIETNKGRGLIFDLFQDKDLSPLKSLKQLLEEGSLTHGDVAQPLLELKKYLIDNKIITSDLRDSNIVCDVKTASPPYLYIIDGVGNRDYIKLTEHISTLGRLKIERQWAKLLRRIKRTIEHSNNHSQKS